MKIGKILPAFALTALALAPTMGIAQIERLSPTRQERELAALAAQLKSGVPAGPMRDHLLRAQKNAAKRREAAILAERVYCDVSNSPPAAPFVHYAVPAMSDVQRLEDVYPIDGEASAPVRICAAKDEFEPGSFLVYPLADLGKVTFSLSPFKTDDGKVFPADKLDLKVVKVWYQNKNGWYSYFGDTDFKLCPELLLNDEDIIRVDTGKKANFARVTGPDGKVREQWINPPRAMDRLDPEKGGTNFRPMAPNFKDAETLQPVLLEEGRFRNFFLTAHVTKDAVAGTYRGAVRLADASGKALGEIPVALTVYPFELPAPKSYQTRDDFLTLAYSYISLGTLESENGGSREQARKQLEVVLRDLSDHNQKMYWTHGNIDTESRFTLRTMKDVGMRTDIIAGGIQVASGIPKAEMEANARRQAAYYQKTLGHNNFLLGFGDEPRASWILKQRPVFEAYQKAGFKFFIAGGKQVFDKAAHVYSWHNVARDPEDGAYAALWNKIGGTHCAWYACMHIGPENPAFNRRQYGMAPYLAGYNATCNYAHHFGPYNDDRTTYKPMVFAYGISSGVIDTIQWEGYREGNDDIRYATLLTSLAHEAAESKDLKTRYAGRLALQYVAVINREEDDLNACRMEMAERILKLRELLGDAR